MIDKRCYSSPAARRSNARAWLGAGAVVSAAFAIATAVAAEGGWLAIDNRSEHPVKVALPGAPSLTVPVGAEPARVDTAADGSTGVTARLWWTSDPRQLCQIYTPWGRTVTVTGSGEILCRSR